MNHTYQQLKNVYHYFQAHAWRLRYGRPDQALKIYGITGTNGKTTTCYILAGILGEEFGRQRVGMLTTVAFRIGGQEEFNASKMTTLPSRLVYQYLARMKKQGVTHVVLEMTSHALDQHRLAGIRLEGAIILNLEREHLDYHQTMAEYAAAKAKIIEYLKPGAPLVGKADDAWVGKILRRTREIITFTSSQAQSIVTPLAGDVNKENALAASLLARAIKISESAIIRGVENVKHVPGRMEWVTAPGGFRVLIDYAVTPAALKNLYQYIRGQTRGRIIGVLGACGLRDRGKRPAMAAAVAQYADELVLTREDPWTEPEEQIFTDLEQGLVGLDVSWRRIFDRREALQYVLGQARTGDVIVVTGKGAERGMGMGTRIIPWNDRQVIESLIVK